MRSSASAYKMCGDVSPAESQRDGPIALCWPTRSLTTAISCMGRDPVLPQEAGVSSYPTPYFDRMCEDNGAELEVVAKLWVSLPL